MATYQSGVLGGYTLICETSEGAASTPDNTSPVTATLKLQCTTQRTQSNQHSFSISVNGSVVGSSSNLMLNFGDLNTTITIWSGTVTITHNADGSKTIPIAASLTFSGQYYTPTGTLSLSGNMTLTTIPRASTITMASSTITLNGSAAQTVTITRAVSTFTHTVEWLVGGTVVATQTGVATSQAITPVAATWLAKIPSAMSATATCRVTTWSGTTQVGSPVTATFTVTVPSTVKPSFTASVSRQANLTPDPGIYIASQSGVTATFASATPGTGATIKSWSITSPDGNASASSATPGSLIIAKLNTVGTRTFTLTLTDTRDQVTTVSTSITVVSGISTLALGATSVAFAENQTFTVTRVATAMTHTVTLTLGTRTWTSTSFATSLTQAISNSWADQIPTVESGEVTAILKTYVGTTLIGQVSTPYLVTVPNAAPFLPTVGNPTATKTGQTALTTYVQGNNGVTIAFSSGVAGTGATLSRWTITSPDGNTQGTGTSGSMSVTALSTAGTRTFTLTVTDSRNRTVTKTIAVTVGAYAPPSITAASAFRATSAGAADATAGTYIRAQATVTFTATGGNTLTRTVAWKKQGASSNTGSQAFTSGTALTLGAGAVTIADNWDVTWTITDLLGYSATTTIMVQSAKRLIHLWAAKMRIAFGGVATIDNLADFLIPARFRQPTQFDGAATFSGGVNVPNSTFLLDKIKGTAGTNRISIPVLRNTAQGGAGTYYQQDDITTRAVGNSVLGMTGLDATNPANVENLGPYPIVNSGIADKAVTASKVAHGMPTNLIGDPRMESTTLWSSTYRQEGGGEEGSNSLFIPANTAVTVWNGSIGNSGQTVAAGTRFLVQYYVRSTTDRAASTARLYGRWYDETDAYNNFAVNNPVLTADTPTLVSAELIVPATRGTMPRVVFGFNTTADNGDVTFSMPSVQVIPTASLTDANGSSTLPSVTANTSIRTLMQTIRNCLKWLVSMVGDASKLSTGTLPIARIAAGAITPDKLADTATLVFPISSSTLYQTLTTAWATLSPSWSANVALTAGRRYRVIIRCKTYGDSANAIGGVQCNAGSYPTIVDASFRADSGASSSGQDNTFLGYFTANATETVTFTVMAKSFVGTVRFYTAGPVGFLGFSVEPM